jgi:hypothetical protein
MRKLYIIGRKKMYLNSYDEDAGYRIHEGVNTISGVCESADTKQNIS